MAERETVRKALSDLLGWADGVTARDMDNCTFLHDRTRCEAMHTSEEAETARAILAEPEAGDEPRRDRRLDPIDPGRMPTDDQVQRHVEAEMAKVDWPEAGGEPQQRDDQALEHAEADFREGRFHVDAPQQEGDLREPLHAIVWSLGLRGGDYIDTMKRIEALVRAELAPLERAVLASWRSTYGRCQVCDRWQAPHNKGLADHAEDCVVPGLIERYAPAEGAD